MGKIISRLLSMNDGQASDEDLIPIEDVSVPKTKVITLARLRVAILKAASVVSSMIKNENYTSNSWNVTKINEKTRIATRKVVAGTFTANQVKNAGNIVLPDGKTYADVTLSSTLNNAAAYVEVFTYGLQFSSSSATSGALFVKNNFNATTGSVDIHLTAIYDI